MSAPPARIVKVEVIVTDPPATSCSGRSVELPFWTAEFVALAWLAPYNNSVRTLLFVDGKRNGALPVFVISVAIVTRTFSVGPES
ncbi:hypothetical protein AORI_4572 [Amycolatopsis keratiniphila]|uniref:Uncharacterized protein n=1 Tax=Amycolatopsis keratiniphila TaxID=129921 RepID=R4T404_9PSEU|nr:hypothetical protein AORI_4572 [Amycolatopsis keratiniphila]